MDLTAKNFNSMAAELTQLKVENRFLKLKLQAVLGKIFGRSSEKISPDQLAPEFGVDSVEPETPAAEAEVEEVVVPRKKRKHKPLSERIPEDLARRGSGHRTRSGAGRSRGVQEHRRRGDDRGARRRTDEVLQAPHHPPEVCA